MTTLQKAILMRCLCWHTIANGIIVSAIVLGWTNSAVAQRRPIADDTLGGESSIVVPLNSDARVERIEGGARRGDNLFHSFQEFNVDVGRSVYFSDPGVNNILARVTGGGQSQILGVLGVLGDANLFLLNPSGIIFGPNARLDLRGSFTATTADAFTFGEQGVFSATDPTAPPLLTVQPTAALFSQLNPAAIANNSIAATGANPSGQPGFGLTVPAGERLTLLGGDIRMNGGGLNAAGGRVEVGGLSQPGTVSFNADGSLSFPTGVARSNVSLSNRSVIDVAASGGGNIGIHAGNFEFSGSGSFLRAGIGRDSGSVGAQGGDIAIDADTVRIRDGAIVGNLVRANGIGNSGDIRINTNSLFITDGSQLLALTLGRGDAGNVIINARDRVSLDGVNPAIPGAFSAIFSTVGNAGSNVNAVGNGGNIPITTGSPSLTNANAVGDGGDIRITTGSLSLTNQAQLATSTLGQGNAGNVIINAGDRVSLDNTSVILAAVGDANLDGIGVGEGGDIRITTGSLFLSDGAQLNASTFFRGNSGNVSIDARDRVSLDGRGTAIFTDVGEPGQNTVAAGEGGNIRIDTDSFSLTDGAQLRTGTFGRGNAGDVIINARDRVALDGNSSSVVSNVGVVDPNRFSLENRNAIGNGGDIRITTGSFSLTNGADLQTATLGAGNAGNVIIEARDRVALDGNETFIVNTVGFPGAITLGLGNGGDIRIDTNSLFLTNGAVLQTTSFGRGNAGNVFINARDRVVVDGASIIFSTIGISNQRVFPIGEGGDIRILTGSFSLTDRSQLQAISFGQGNAGNVIIDARDRVVLDGGAIIFSTLGLDNQNRAAVGEGGDIRITTGSLSLTDRSQLQTTTFGRGDAGNVIINARDRVALDGASSIIFSAVGSVNRANTAVRGDGGDIRIDTGSLFLTDGAQLQASTFGEGDAGNVIIDARDRVVLNGQGEERFPSAISSSVGVNNQNRSAVGDGGDIRITTGSLLLTDAARLQASTLGQGNAGSIFINARDRVTLNNGDVFSSVNPGAVGDGRNIEITTSALRLTNGSQLSASTTGQGDAGDVIINARDRASFDNSSILSSVNANAIGEGGDIGIRAGSLFLTNGTQFAASTAGQGDAGDVTIRARDRTSLNNSSILSSVNSGAEGNGRNIEITTSALRLTNGSQLSASTTGQGNAGSVTIRVRDRVSLNNSSILSSVNSGAEGNGRNIEITTASLSLANGARLTASTFGDGNAGNVSINASDRVSLEGSRQSGSEIVQSGIFTTTTPEAEGQGGDVNIAGDRVRLAEGAAISTETQNRSSGGNVTLNANTFEAIEGGQVITGTSGEGEAGDITLNASDRITLSGANSFNISGNQGTASGLFANTAPNSAGRGGTVELTTGQLQVFDRARIAVDSQGSDIAGDINITASSVQLNDQARITAETTASNGGEINLRDVEILQLSNNSLISTTAGTAQAGGNGGNIDIDADFIIALPNDNSDIRANAFRGNGGNVSITTDGLFGIAVQPQDNPFTNDITASSQQGVQGTVNVTTPDVDPRRGLAELPVEVVDASTQIAQTCSGAGAGRGEFVVTGRGGVPTSPIDPLVGDDSLSEWSSLDEQDTAVAPQNSEAVIAPPNRETDAAQAGAIVEAQGWVVAEDGTVRLIAAASASATQATCQASENQ